MGEYAKYQGQEIKIGTCEEMYYLRFDQRDKVRPMGGNVDPVRDAHELRFRFPWPDEDRNEPGAFADPFRAVPIPGAACTAPEHHPVQFVAQAGYNVCLPCPESLPALTFHGATIHRNGFRGSVLLTQQRLIPGESGDLRPENSRLVPVLMCGGCGSKYRVEEAHEIEALAVALRAEGDARDRHERVCRESSERREGHAINWAPMPSEFYNAIADRLLAGARIAGTVYGSAVVGIDKATESPRT